MATIPQAVDYGARPSLRSSRVDLPGQGELAVAEAISAAADTFGKTMIERKEKQDAFNYSMAIKKYQTDDLAEREKLKDDREYEKFDEKYTSGMATALERISKAHPMSPHDAAIFGAETDLIKQRGRGSVQEHRRVLEIDDKNAELDAALELIKEEVQIAAPGEANHLLINGLDAIKAGEDELWVSETDGQKKREDLAQSVAFNKLDNMEPELRKEILEGSLKHRKDQGPITVDAIRAGEGTGYIADFLHTATAKGMLEETIKELEIDGAQAEGYAAKDKAWEVNPGLGKEATKARYDSYKSLSPEGRKAAEAADARQVLIDNNLRQEEYKEIEDELRRQIDVERKGFNQLPGALLKKLPLSRQNALEGHARRMREGEAFNDHVTNHAAETYRDLTPRGQAEFQSEGYMPQVIPLAPSEKWSDHITREQADLWNNAAQQTRDQLNANQPEPESGLPLLTLGNRIFSNVMKPPTAGASDEYRRKWNRMWLKYHNDAIRAGGEGKLTGEERTKIMMDVIKFEVFERETFMGIDRLNPDNPEQFATMTDEQIRRSYLPLNHPVPPFGFTAGEMEVNWEAEGELPAYKGTALEWLRTTGKAVNPAGKGTAVEEDDLEEAFFYLVTQGRQAAFYRLQGLEGY